MSAYSSLVQLGRYQLKVPQRVAATIVIGFVSITDIARTTHIKGVMIDFIIVHGNNSFLDCIDIVSWNREEVKMDIIC